MGLDGGQIYLVIAGTFFGFLALAWVLLFPVYRFLRNQERESDDWTDAAVRRRVLETEEQEADSEEPSAPTPLP